MRTQVFAVASLLATGALAGEWRKVEPHTAAALRNLRVRQGGESFKPDTNSGYGDSCADAFGKGHELCGTSDSCYNPGEGDVCCDGEYACPVGSFCLTKGYCCEDGLDPETCAKQHGIEPQPSNTPIPPGNAPVVSITTTICPSSEVVPTGGVPTPTGGVPVPTGGYPVPTGGYPAPTGNHTVIPTGAPTATPPPFNNGAAQNMAQGAVAAVAFLGFAYNLL